MEEVRFLTCGDCAVTVAFRQEIREDTNRKIRYLAQKLQNSGIHGLLETVPTYCSLTVYYEPLVLPRRKLERLILHQLSSYRADCAEIKRVFEIPVCYEEAFAPDMADVCRLTGLSREQLSAPMDTLSFRVVPGLRLIPYRAVGGRGAHRPGGTGTGG